MFCIFYCIFAHGLQINEQQRSIMYYTGIIIAIMTFLTIGVWHPIVIKTEYYWGTRPWFLYLVIGLCCCIAALFVENIYISSFLGVFGASSLWGIGELFAQRKRVEKGWFPMNPKRKNEYKNSSPNDR